MLQPQSGDPPGCKLAGYNISVCVLYVSDNREVHLGMLAWGFRPNKQTNKYSTESTSLSFVHTRDFFLNTVIIIRKNNNNNKQ